MGVIGLLISLSGSSAFGQAGAPDPEFQAQQLAPTGITLQSDGKILLSGNFTQNSTTYTLMRENADGTVDASFYGSAESTAAAFDLTPSNGAIYLVHQVAGQNDSFLQRYIESSGAIDTTFTPIDVTSLNFTQFLILANGQILVVGNTITRWNADGTQDTTFHSPSASFISGAPPTISPGGFSGAIVAAGGKIYVWGGFNSISNTAYNDIARLNADGSLDTTFVPAIDANTQVDQVYLEPSGSLLVSVDIASSALTLIRLETDGSADASFQSPQIDFFLYDYFNFTETPDQKILLWGTGVAGVDGTSASAVAKLNLDGTLDSNFVSNATNLGSPYTVTIQPDGKLILFGVMEETGVSYTVPIIRLNADGSRDADFDMVPESPLGASLGQYQTAQSLLQPDGKLLVHLAPIPLYGGGGYGGTVTIGPTPDTAARFPGTPRRPTVVMCPTSPLRRR